MKTALIITGAVLAAVIALSVAGFAYAYTQTPTNPDGPWGGWSSGHMGGYGHMGSYGHMGGYGWNSEYGPMHSDMIEVFSQELGLDPEALETRHEEGESLWEIAQEQGLSDEEVYQLMEKAHDQALDQAVADGYLSQEQAEWMDDHMQSAAANGFVPGSCHGSDGFSDGLRGRSGQN